mgnify:FL=1
MKGQTQAVTAVMITGIMIGTIAAVYVWGTPLLEKRESQAQLDQIENDILGLKDSIQSISNSGEGAGSEMEIEIDNGEVRINETGNFIEVTTTAQASGYPEGSWTLLDGSNLQGLSFASGRYGIRGRDSTGVVAAQGDSIGTGSVTYRIEFRNLLDDSRDTPIIEVIDLEAAGAQRATGDTTISVTNVGERVDEDAFRLGTGENIDIQRSMIRVDLQ